MDPALRLQPGQQELTPEQEKEAMRFADERIQAQLATSPVDEPEAEAWLRQAYAVAGLAPPARIQWVDGPLQLVAALVPPNALDRVRTSVGASVAKRVEFDVYARVVTASVVTASLGASVRNSVTASIWDSVGDSVWLSIWDSVGDSRARAGIKAGVGDIATTSIRAYCNASWLVLYHFFDVYLAPNDLHALAHFNTLVSGYWLGTEAALIVRRPRVLCRDAEGRLHNETGKCIEYHDGWGFYAWHGVRVPEKIILAPERLSREDVLNEEDVEVRRVVQDRMGDRFMSELGGQVIDSGPRGVLYEVRLPEDDPEEVARYVQVQDASTARRYFLRVPPTIQTAAEAVAWSFGLPAEVYHPAQET